MSGHSRTDPEHLDETAGNMHQAASDVESAAGDFDSKMAGTDYGGGTTAQLVHSVVSGVGAAVGGGPEGAGGKVAKHKHDYADNISLHAANARQNESDTAAMLKAIGEAKTPEAVVAAAEQHLQQKLAAEADRRDHPDSEPGESEPSQLDKLVNRMVDRSRDVEGTHPGNGPDPDLPAHTVTVEWKPGMPKVQFARKALALRRLGNDGNLFKAKEPTARDTQITKDYKGALINIIQGVHGKSNPELAEQSSALARSMQPDHVSELQVGGADSWHNLQMLHGPTNYEIGTQQIRSQIRGLPPGTPIRVRIKWW